MQKINQKYIISVVKKALDEDLRPMGDITTKLIKLSNKKIKAKIIAKQNGVIAGIAFCKQAFKLIGKESIFKSKIKDGKSIRKNKVIAEILANTKTILTAERTALNFLNHASGIATTTNNFVKKVGKKTKICCTRKTIPSLRIIQKYAVKIGGGTNHRFNLSDEILIKDNHIAVNKNLVNLVKKSIKNKKRNKITVEVDTLNQFKKISGLKFHRILFDNMSPKDLKKGIKLSKKLYETEASGGITYKNVKNFAKTGVDRISIGLLTHSVKSIDLKIEI